MVNISNFNSLWEIAFAINAIFVFFELAPLLERKFIGTNSLGKSIIDKMIAEEDQSYINNYGWRSIIFGHFLWLSRLKWLSALNSAIAIILIVIAGFNPTSTLGSLSICIIILILFTPIVLIPAIILYKLPLYKLKCIEEAIENILNRENQEQEAIAAKARKYKISLEYIKLIEFNSSPWVRRNAEFSDSEILEEIGE